jgi:hypothetical protein
MTTPTQELCERLQEYADEDLDLGWKTNRAKAHLDAKAMIESQAAHIAELQAQITSANDAWMELYGALTKRYEELESQLAEDKKGEAVAWMTDDGRVATDETKRTAMPTASREAFHIPLYAHPAASIPVAIVKADHDGTKHAILRDETAADGTLLYAGRPPAEAASEDRLDAERWRYVKNHYLVLIEGDDADAFIDAAIAAEKEKEK